VNRTADRPAALGGPTVRARALPKHARPRFTIIETDRSGIVTLNHFWPAYQKSFSMIRGRPARPGPHGRTLRLPEGRPHAPRGPGDQPRAEPSGARLASSDLTPAIVLSSYGSVHLVGSATAHIQPHRLRAAPLPCSGGSTRGTSRRTSTAKTCGRTGRSSNPVHTKDGPVLAMYSLLPGQIKSSPVFRCAVLGMQVRCATQCYLIQNHSVHSAGGHACMRLTRVFN
jgi:hypothetical protein